MSKSWQEIDKLTRIELDKHNLDNVDIYFDSYPDDIPWNKRCMAKQSYRIEKGKINPCIIFYMEVLQEADRRSYCTYDEILIDAIRHEIAHILHKEELLKQVSLDYPLLDEKATFEIMAKRRRGYNSSHGPAWKKVARKIGAVDHYKGIRRGIYKD